MPAGHPSNIYQEQLSSDSHGLALWDPNPVEGLFKDPGHVSIGDVGYLDNGTFIRIFNAKLPRNDPSNKFIEIPEAYKPLKRKAFENVRHSEVRQEEYHSHVSKVCNVGANTHEEYMGQTYECEAQSHGALLYLPHGAHSEDVIRTKVFEDYMRDNVDSWLQWSKKEGLPVENAEDLILVTGCTLAKSWAVAAFDGTTSRDEDVATISLEARKSDGGGAQFIWRNLRGSVVYNHRYSNIEGPKNQCIFIRGFRAKQRSQGSHFVGAGIINLLQIGSTLLQIGNTLLLRIRSPYPSSTALQGNGHLYNASNPSLDTIRLPINHEDLQLRPYPSSTGSTAPQSNGDPYNASLFMTSPSEHSVIEVRNDTVEVCPHGYDRSLTTMSDCRTGQKDPQSVWELVHWAPVTLNLTERRERWAWEHVQARMQRQ